MSDLNNRKHRGVLRRYLLLLPVLALGLAQYRWQRRGRCSADANRLVDRRGARHVVRPLRASEFH